MQICGVFVAVVVAKNSLFFLQIWKPQFLSVVQFPFDNCHSPFSPTTFFEIGVYLSQTPSREFAGTLKDDTGGASL